MALAHPHAVAATDLALLVLDAFALDRPEWSVAELADALGVYRSRVHRAVATLLSRGFLRAYTLSRPVEPFDWDEPRAAAVWPEPVRRGLERMWERREDLVTLVEACPQTFFVLDADTGKFYFLEVNTRLQVEHGVTEEVFGVDLVEWMIRLAAKELEPLSELKPVAVGCSIQARIYAEDPYKDFAPSPGKLTEATLTHAAAKVTFKLVARTGGDANSLLRASANCTMLTVRVPGGLRSGRPAPPKK